MAENEKTIHQLDSLNINSSTEFEIDNVDPLDPTKRVSGKTTANALGLDIATVQQYTSALDGFTSKTVTGALQELRTSGGSANGNIAHAFSTASTYAIGDLVIYSDNLYKCTTAVSTAGAWDASKWTQTVIADELGSGGNVPDISEVVFPQVQEGE